MTELIKGAHVDKKERKKLGKEYAKRYKKGESIRAIATDQGRSFGFVHSVLSEAGVELRSRGTAKGTARPRSKPAPLDEGGNDTNGDVVDQDSKIESDQTVTEEDNPPF